MNHPSLEHLDPEALEKPAALIRELDRLAGGGCVGCRKILCGHEVLFSVALGIKDAPRCLRCAAGEMDLDPGDLRQQLGEYVQRRDCYRQAWDVASDREGFNRGRFPSCLWPTRGNEILPPSPPKVEQKTTIAGELISAEHSWDAGDMGCGDLVLALRGRLNSLPPGTVLKVTARDPAAPEDLPAWCRLTGHRLIDARHPVYFIQRKEN